MTLLNRGRRIAVGLLVTGLAGAATVSLAGPAAAVTSDCSVDNPVYIDADNYAMNRLRYSTAWRRSVGEGVTVAVVDSGVHTDNLHLPPGEAVLPGATLVPGDTSRGQLDLHSHGTAIAGIIAARPLGSDDLPPGESSALVGIAPRAKILPIRFYDLAGGQGGEREPTVPNIAWGVREATRLGADVINVSFTTEDDVAALRRAVAKAVAKDIVVVASSGNRAVNEATGEYFEPYQHPTDEARFPAAYPGVIGVAASNQQDIVTDSVYHGTHVDVTAPGERVLTAYRDAGDCYFATADAAESSFSTAYVSGLAALLKAEFPDESGEEIRYRILASANGSTAGRSRRDGYGMIQPTEALTMTLPRTESGELQPLDGSVQELRSTDVRALPDSVDPLAQPRQTMLWWGLLGGGMLALALVVKPLIALRRRD